MNTALANTPIVTGETPRPAGTPDPPRRSGPSNIEVLIPTFNEELNLPFALRSVVSWADAVYVVDSESTDRTQEIARRMGAKLVVQPWLGYAKQKNWALENLPLKADWIFILDADESITPELRDELIEIAQRPVAGIVESGFYVNRLTYFMGKPIRHCGFFPSYNLRFFKRGRAWYEDREVHEHMVVEGETRRLRHIMLHEDRRGLEHFIAKHNRYSTLEARELLRDRMGVKRGQARVLERGIALRRWLKYHVQPRLPVPGFWRFMYMYFVRLGFLDGIPGFRFSLLLSTYDFFISLKLAELKQLIAESRTEAAIAPAPRGLARPEGTVAPEAQPDVTEVQPATDRRAPSAGRVAVPPPPPVPVTRAVRAKWRHDDLGDRRPFVADDAATCPHPPISVIILTYNERDNIAPCIESCRWSDDIHVLDSGSTDGTRDIAESLGAKVYVNPFKSFGQQRNWAIDNIPVKYRWQFQVDADERFTPALVREMADRISDGRSIDNVVCYQCPSMMMFMDRWVRHAAEYPVYQVRLLDKERCRFEDYGHGQREVPDGPTGVLEMPYLHYSFSKGLEEWFDKHNRYSTLEATQALAEPPVELRRAVADLLSGDSVRRRRRLKALSYGMPAKSTVVMLYMMLLRLGFLDGKAGWNYARMRAIYEAMIAVKLSVYRDGARRGSGEGRITSHRRG